MKEHALHDSFYKYADELEDILQEHFVEVVMTLGIDDIFDESEIIEYVTSWFVPAEVFSERALEEWAQENGFVHKSEIG